MRALLIIMSIFLVTCAYAQGNKDSLNTNDSIAQLSKLLTGKWQLVGYFNKGIFIETELSSSIGDSIIETKIMTDSGLIKKTFRNDSLVSVKKIREIDLIEMSFNENGEGYYIHFSDYKTDSNLQSLSTCQPIPEIRYKNGKYVLHFTSYFPSGTENDEEGFEFIINGDTLIFKLKDNKEERYIKYIKKTPCNSVYIMRVSE